MTGDPLSPGQHSRREDRPERRGVDDSELDRTWSVILKAMSARTPVAVLLEGDAGRCLPVWRSSAAASGVDWWDAATAGSDWAPFDLWTHVAESLPHGSQLARRLRFGPDQPLDPGCPMLPDPVGVHHAILRWLAATAETPLVVVLNDLDATDEDSWAALDYVIRGLEAVPLTIVMHAGAGLGSRGKLFMGALVDDALVLRRAGRPLAKGPVSRPASPTSIAFGLDCCRTGAVRTGGAVLAGSLASAGGPALSREDEATAWRYLAMAMLTRGQFGFASTAVSGAMALERESATRRLLRRIDLLAGSAQGDGVKLREMAGQIASEFVGGGPEGTEAGWLRLDRALISSRGDSKEAHERDLRDVLNLPQGQASPQCRAVAHLWLGAVLTLNDDVPNAVEHQRAGLVLLDSLGEESRSVPTRVRLGAALFGLGRWAEATAQCTLAARLATRVGDHELTAECLCMASRAQVALGQLASAQRLLNGARVPRARVWAGERARSLRIHARGVLALARGDQKAAEEAGEKVWSSLGAHEETPAWVRLRCEAAFLLADVADVRGDGARCHDWVSRGLELVARASAEERPALAAAGRRRLIGREPSDH